ncbi:hypothetical protein [Pseudonocardia sp. GCM10023141]
MEIDVTALQLFPVEELTVLGKCEWATCDPHGSCKRSDTAVV